ncbi:MAG: TlpA disulfide reductase family protein [Chloroflexota bacterium]
MSAPRSRGMPRRSTERLPGRRSSGPLIWIALAVIVVVAAVAAILLTSGAGGPTAEPAPRLTVSGAALPMLPAEGTDPAVGATLPTLTGTALDGSALVIGPTGTPQVVAVVAHWCSNCQAEVPRIVTWLRDNSLPGGVTLTTLSTSIDPARPNFPPSAWLRREGWTAPVLTDDAASSGLAALGISGFPGFVFVNGDGTVAGRMVGQIDPEQLASIAATLH